VHGQLSAQTGVQEVDPQHTVELCIAVFSWSEPRLQGCAQLLSTAAAILRRHPAAIFVAHNAWVPVIPGLQPTCCSREPHRRPFRSMAPVGPIGDDAAILDLMRKSIQLTIYCTRWVPM
jgi:hypothetical protein